MQTGKTSQAPHINLLLQPGWNRHAKHAKCMTLHVFLLFIDFCARTLEGQKPACMGRPGLVVTAFTLVNISQAGFILDANICIDTYVKIY